MTFAEREQGDVLLAYDQRFAAINVGRLRHEIDQVFAGDKAGLRPVYDKLLAAVQDGLKVLAITGTRRGEGRKARAGGDMTAYIIRRLWQMIPTLLGILFVSFVVVQFAPGGPVERVLAQLNDRGIK